MKQEPEYKIQFAGTRTMDEYRGDRVIGRVWDITKFVPPTDITKYEVVVSSVGDICNCPAGRNGRPCKHIRMIYETEASLIEDDEEDQSGD